MRFLTPFPVGRCRSLRSSRAQTRPTRSHTQAARADIAELWQEPADLLERDLFNGPGGAELAPPPNGTYRIRRVQDDGHQPRLRREGRVGPVVERQARHRGAIGSHRVADPVGDGLPAARDLFRAAIHADRRRRRREDHARFRTDLDAVAIGRRVVVVREPLRRTRTQFRGLIVAQLVLNNWDLKTDEQPHLRSDRSRRRAAASIHGARRRLVARPLEAVPAVRDARHARQRRAARTTSTTSSSRGSSRRSKATRSRFDYRGMNQALVDTVTVAGRDLGVRAAGEDSRRTLAGGVQGRRVSAGPMPIATSGRSRKRSRRVLR